MKRLTLFIAAALLTAACSDDNGPAPEKGRKVVWESYTHAELMKLKGAVKQAVQSFQEEGERYTLLTASFDKAGHCTAFNDTGVEPNAASFALRDWGVSAAYYTYGYDKIGRIEKATKYEVGADPVVYTVTYGSHNTYVIAPFPLGNISPLMLRGVTRIESEGYLLTCDGMKAQSTQLRAGWGATIDEATYTFENGLPAVILKITYEANGNQEKGAEISRSETIYTYDRSWLSSSDETVFPADGDDSQRTLTGYSAQWPCTPTFKEVYFNNSSAPEYRLEYLYGENGLPKQAKYTIGTFFDEEFQQHYNKYDNTGNWISATRAADGQTMSLEQQIAYW